MGRRIWILTASGRKFPTMVRCGVPRWEWTGLRIARAAGYGKTGMVGLGSATIHGVGLRTITGVGSSTPGLDGAGIRARGVTGTSGRRRWWAGSDTAAESVSVLVSGTSGWVPLAPFETFHPWWGRGFYGGRNFGRNINITNVNISNTYRNARIGNGVSGMAAGDFRAGRYNSVGRVSGEQMRSAGTGPGADADRADESQSEFQQSRSFVYAAYGGEHALLCAPGARCEPARVRLASRRGPWAGNGIGASHGNGQPPASEREPAAGCESPRRAEFAAGRYRLRAQVRTAPRAAVGDASGNRHRATATNGFRNPSVENTRPSQSGGTAWQRFGTPNASRNAPTGNAPRYNAPAQRNYSAPAQRNYSAPAQRSAPSYSAPRGGGGGGNHASSGGGGHSSGGGNRGRR